MNFVHCLVLIVAKCIVNPNSFEEFTDFMIVLIVAKCIVNVCFINFRKFKCQSINSSKVYCKLKKITLLSVENVVLIVAKCIVNDVANILNTASGRY